MTDTTKPKSGGDIKTETMDTDENEQVTTPTTNAVDNSGFAVWCKDNGLSDQVVQTLLDAGFRTPKDLMDRENDLDDLVRLSRRDFRILDDAIERMRNASASNLVNNAALGLTTMGKQKHSAARDDEPMDAQRAVELNEQIRQAFRTYQSQNQLEWQQDNLPAKKFVKNVVPFVGGKVAFIASDQYAGDSNRTLNSQYVAPSLDSDNQERNITAVVQSFGSGKTRVALELVNYYVVLPIRMTSNHVLIDALITQQKQLREAPNTPWTQDEIVLFSTRCLRLTHLVLLSLRMLFAHCVELEVVHSACAIDRRVFAALVYRQSIPLMQWALDWFQERKTAVLNMSDSDFDKMVDEISNGSDAVFVLDEIQRTFEECRGYCLHIALEKEDSTLIKRWLAEQGKKLTRRETTDLFYQFRRVIQMYIEARKCSSAFVMCSTMFHIWDEIEELRSPFGREYIDRFHQLHWFSYDDVQRHVQHYFDVPDELFTDECKAQLSKFRRPLFVAILLKALANNIAGASKQSWFDSALKIAIGKVRSKADIKVGRLADSTENLLADGTSSTDLLYLLYVIMKLCGGKLKVASIKMVTLIDQGFVRLEDPDGNVSTADPFFNEAVVDKVEKLLPRRDRIIDQLVSLSSNSAVIDNKEAKGYVFERVIAWLALQSKLKVNVNKGTVVLCTGSLNKQAGKRQQLQERLPERQENEPEFVWRVMCDDAYRFVLFPDSLCGPDVLFRQFNGDKRIVVVQSKGEAKTYALEDFKAALRSLHPAFFFKWSKDEKPETKKTSDRTFWLERADELNSFAFQRVVFAALGFNTRVQYLVREYNYAEERKQEDAKLMADTYIPRYIHLLNLDDIKPQIGVEAYCELRKQLPGTMAENVQQQLMLQSEWTNLTEGQKLGRDLPELKTMCEVRKLPHGGQDKKPLIAALDAYCVHRELDEHKFELREMRKVLKEWEHAEGGKN